MSETKAHKHAALMMQYAQDAMETENPWERWQFKDDRGYWRSRAIISRGYTSEGINKP